MKTNFLAFCIGSLIFFACANENKPATNTSDSTTNAAVDNTTPAPQQPTETTIPAPTFKMAPEATAINPATGINPAHGEPGHRCDIAVGAPLNSAPTSSLAPRAGAPVPSITPLGQIKPNSPTTTTTTAPGMNPPHGQPGHDCAIAVGAPLKK